MAINNTICWWYLLNRVKNWPQDCVKFTIFMTVKKEMRSRYYRYHSLFWSAAYLQPVCHNFYSHWLHVINDCRKYSKNAGDKITRSMITLITIKIFAVKEIFCHISEISTNVLKPTDFFRLMKNDVWPRPGQGKRVILSIS